MSKSLLLFLLYFSLASFQTQADTLLFEDFEDSLVTYTTNISELSDSDMDYFGRVAPDGIAIGSSIMFTNQQGSGFFAAMDTDGLMGAPDLGVLSFIINISGFNNLHLSTLFAEDDAEDGNQDWDANTSFLARYKIDSNPMLNLLAFESVGSTNTEPALDSDFDGVGDGARLTDVFTAYQTDIVGMGDMLTLEFILNNFDAGDEDIAFDNVLITGDPVTAPVPIPAAIWLFGSTLFGLLTMYRKHQ